MIQDFEIPSFTTSQLSDLHQRIDSGIQPHEFTNQKDSWQYGTPWKALEPLVAEWRNSYDWEDARTELNQWHHYKYTTEQGLKIHFVHEVSSDPNAIPLILCHGWPSTFYEFHKVINPLRDGKLGAQAYHVIVPSLPGYGFSDPPTAPGFGTTKIGDVFNELMLALGYSKYVAHGTDWGSVVCRSMASNHDKHCSAVHVTLFACAPPFPTLSNLWQHPTKVAKFLLAAKVLGFDTVYGQGKLKSMGQNFVDANNNPDAGYRAIQGTRPYSLAYGLTDSPIALLGWMLEKYHFWTHHEDGDIQVATLPSTITVKEVLTQVSIYWLTNTMSSSIRLYYEFLQQTKTMKTGMMGYIHIPLGISTFKSELSRVPKDWIETAGNLKFFNEHPLGGHFSALEVPELLVADLRSFGKEAAIVFE
ncbi:unnamed protein product [Absidia cylindrospora]